MPVVGWTRAKSHNLTTPSFAAEAKRTEGEEEGGREEGGEEEGVRKRTSATQPLWPRKERRRAGGEEEEEEEEEGLCGCRFIWKIAMWPCFPAAASKEEEEEDEEDEVEEEGWRCRE